MKKPMSYKEFIEMNEIHSNPEISEHIANLKPKLSEVYLDFGHMHLEELANYYEGVLDALSKNTKSTLHTITMGETTLTAEIPFDENNITVNERAILLLALTAVSFKEYARYMRKVIASNGKSDTPTTSPIVEMKKYL